jgi:arginyl-tRNA synthetase
LCSYDSTDLAAILYRFQEIKCDWVIYITDAGQATHFHMIFEAARRAGTPTADTQTHTMCL